MRLDLIIFIDFLAILMQIFAAYFSYKIYSFNRMSKWWLALIFAFVIQGVRRVFNVFEDLGVISRNLLIDRSLMFLISALMVVGLWAMLRNFENFELFERKVKEKLRR